MRQLCANPLMRSYDYGQSPYSRMDEFDSIEDFLSKRRKKRKAALEKIAMDGDMFMQLPYQNPVHKVPATDPKDHHVGPCPHRNTQEVAIKADSVTVCLDCNQIVRTPYLNRGDWDGNDFPVNNMEYNELGSAEAEPILY